MRNAIIGLWPFLLGFTLLLVALALGCGPGSDDHDQGSESSNTSDGETLECEPTVYWVDEVAFTCCCNEQEGVDVAQRPLCPESAGCP